MILRYSLILILVGSFQSYGQTIDYFRVHLGPKIDRYTVTQNDNVRAKLHMDAGAGIYVGKLITEQFYGEIGLVKNDYSAKFEIDAIQPNGTVLTGFGNQLYPTFTTTQLSLAAGYRYPLSKKVTLYGQGGFNVIVNKKLSREGSQTFTEEVRNDEFGLTETLQVVTYSNGFGPGGFVFRGDVGTFIHVGKDLFIDLSLSARSSSLVLNEFDIEYIAESDSQKRGARLSTKGTGFGLYLGIKYRISKESS
jgi:hypothetical protein